MAATTVAILRLPLSSVVITLLLTSRSGAAVAPIIIVAVVVAYITIETLDAVRSTLVRSPTNVTPGPRHE
jgi:hypothetical protein